ncbi:guanine nucleotide binding protein, alpha subunit [Neocallimastix lanati (nom. inval.)]|jgi:GTPase SAR1 family protein|uniref:Guanine nucleotide binding protein, alpha subunit n=1 Tax=Neocallimastix californiae TaxID=1754190 RepID=A0A1Y2EN65_9FUNG|nr:guanine nucleotide binding protein, alpha subunit [Neocallimastix sp. JGI-2020a]ORY72676.1 guanine nucleotide binding protein, alpha subunit [Neocallimastix californiae]|eukprot:ORY72676.1 guanine nucleotide binding protein, alpha subunit [Neocallimastix californiae]
MNIIKKLKKSNKVASKNEIDEKLEIDGLEERLNLKILLLGSGESGKSTVLKQLKLINKIELENDELLEYKNGLRRNVLQCMNILTGQLKPHELEYEKPESQDLALLLKKAEEQYLNEDNSYFTSEVASAINFLWTNEPSIKKVWEKRNNFWIMDAAYYYFDNVMRFVDDDFELTEEDYVMSRIMTTGIISTEISIPPLKYTVIDVGGQRNERRKWLHCFDNVSALLFIVNLSGYNSVLFEDNSVNRMKECFDLFKQTANNEIFKNTPIFLLFNKKDLFEEKIRTDSINICEEFADYTGSGDLMDSLSFIEKKFKSAINNGDPDRIQVFHIAARFKRDIKTTWDDVVSKLKDMKKKEIESIIKELKSKNVDTFSSS